MLFSAEKVIKNWSELDKTGIKEDTRGIFSYDNTSFTNFIWENQNLTFLNSRATLTIDATIFGTWNKGEPAPCGLLFCFNETKDEAASRYVFNQGNIVLSLNTDGVTNSNLGIFDLSQKSTLDINSNLTITTIQESKLNNGIFHLSDNAKLVINGNLTVTPQYEANSKLFVLEGSSSAKIGYENNQTSQLINLFGNILLKGNSNFTLDLANPSSFFEGTIELQNSANLALNLSNSTTAFIYKLTETPNAPQPPPTKEETTRLISINQATLGMSSNAPTTNLSLSNQAIYQSWGAPQPANPPQDPPQDPQPRQDTIGNINLNNSTVTLMYNAPYQNRISTPHIQKTLNASAISGSGTIQLYADISQKTTDTTTFKTAGGNHTIQMFYNPKTFSQDLAKGISEADNMIVSTITDIESKVNFEGGITDLGLLSYKTNLTKRTNGTNIQWLISSITPSGESYLSRALSTALNSSHRLFENSAQMLFTRMGDLRNYPKDYGLYFHYLIGYNLLSPDNNVLETDELYMTFNGGYDWNEVFSNRVDFWGFGAQVDILNSTNSAYKGNTMGYGLNLYYTSIYRNRFYYDLLMNYTYAPSEFDFSTPTLHTHSSISSHNLTFAAEVGQKFALQPSKDFFYIEPQTRLISGMIFPITLEVTENTQDTIHSQTAFDVPLLSKTTLYGGYEWNSDFKGDIKLGMFLSYALFNGSSITLTDPRNTITKRFKYDLDVGFSALGSIEVEDALRLYFELNSGFLGDYTTPINFNIGLRWSFGDRYVPPPPPPVNPGRFNVKYKNKGVRDIPTVKRDDIENMYHYNTNSRPLSNRNSIPNETNQEIPQNNLDNRYNHSTLPPPKTQESGNKNRLSPRDTYVPRYQNNAQKGYNRKYQRDTYQPGEKEEEE